MVLCAEEMKEEKEQSRKGQGLLVAEVISELWGSSSPPSKQLSLGTGAMRDDRNGPGGPPFSAAYRSATPGASERISVLAVIHWGGTRLLISDLTHQLGPMTAPEIQLLSYKLS